MHQLWGIPMSYWYPIASLQNFLKVLFAYSRWEIFRRRYLRWFQIRSDRQSNILFRFFLHLWGTISFSLGFYTDWLWGSSGLTDFLRLVIIDLVFFLELMQAAQAGIADAIEEH